MHMRRRMVIFGIAGFAFGILLGLAGMLGIEIIRSISPNARESSDIQKEREAVIRDINDELVSEDAEEIRLPEKYKQTSDGGVIRLYSRETEEDADNMQQSLVAGFYSSEDHLQLTVYTSDGLTSTIVHMFPDCSSFKKLKDNWYYIVLES